MTPDLRTEYLGLQLANPLVASASPLSASLDTLRRLEEAGAGAVVLQSLFEEQIEHEELHVHHVMEAGAGTQPETCAYFPELDDYNTGPRAYLDHLEAARSAIDGLVLFNRFLEPDIDLEALTVTPTLHLSTPEEVRLPLRWMAVLHGQVTCSL